MSYEAAAMLTTKRRLGARTILPCVAILALGCGSSDAGYESADAAPATATTDTSTSASDSATTQETGAEAGVDDATVDDASPTDVVSTETPADSGAGVDSIVIDSAADVSPPESAPPSTWGCAESDKVCDCYDAHLTAGYSQPSCTKTYPCCVRFVVDNGKVPPYDGCDCYSDAYLAGLGKTCAQMVDRINGISIYKSAVTTPSCPSP